MGMHLINVRIDDELRKKLKLLRSIGYLPAAIIRSGIEKEVDLKLKAAKEKGELQ